MQNTWHPGCWRRVMTDLLRRRVPNQLVLLGLITGCYLCICRDGIPMGISLFLKRCILADPSAVPVLSSGGNRSRRCKAYFSTVSDDRRVPNPGPDFDIFSYRSDTCSHSTYQRETAFFQKRQSSCPSCTLYLVS